VAELTTYVLVHGAGEGGWVWKQTAQLLRAEGHIVYTPTLDGCAERHNQMRPGITIESQGDEIAELLFFEDLSNVVLVATSTGGMVICRTAERARERIGRLVFLDALALLDGETVGQAVGKPTQQSGSARVSITPGPTFFREADFSDAKTREWALARSTPFPGSTSDCAVSLDRFWTLTWNALIVRCLRGDPAEPLQRRTAEMLGAEYVEIDTGHYPMLSDPKLVADLLMGG
jgi:pimeloyl-ACP methyl ester carboxylesterase